MGITAIEHRRSMALPRTEAKERMGAIAKRVRQLAASAYGPMGAAKAMLANTQCADAVVIGSSSGVILQHITIDACPVADVYVHMLRNQLRVHSDGGLFAAFLSSRLMIDALDGPLSGIPHQQVVQGLQLALTWCNEYLSAPHCPVRISLDWSDVDLVHAVMRGVLSPKKRVSGLSVDALEQAVSLTLEAFLSVHQQLTEYPSEPVPVRFFHLSEHKFKSSAVWKHSVLLDVRWPSLGGIRPPIANALVALFDISILPTKRATEESSVHLTSDNVDTGAFSRDALVHLVDALVAAGVGVVLCQRLIPRFMQLYAASKGIICIERLGIQHMRAVQMLTGARALSTWCLRTIDPSALGSLSLLTTQEIGHNEVVRLSRIPGPGVPWSDRAQSITTMVLSVPDRHAFGELSRAVEAALRTLTRLMDNPQVVYGAGCAEIHLAQWLRHKAGQLRPTALSQTRHQDVLRLRNLRRVIVQVAEALEALTTQTALGQTTHQQRDSVLDALRGNQDHQQSHSGDGGGSSAKLYGWDCQRHQVVDFGSSDAIDPSAFILDSLCTKRDALALAIESACALVRIAAVVIIK